MLFVDVIDFSITDKKMKKRFLNQHVKDIIFFVSKE